MLEIRDLHTYIGKSHILHGIGITVGEGELVSLMGRNGAGKSTTLKSTMGILRQRSGTIRSGGSDLMPLATHQIARLGIAYVPDDRRIFSDLTVLDNLKIAAMAKSKWTLDRVLSLFPELSLRRNSKGKSLSGGEQQMLALGRALMSGPRLLLVDEPFQGLAPRVVQNLIETIRQIKREKISILLVEQNLQATTDLADRHYILEQGIIVYEGDAEDFKKNDTVKEKYLSV